MNAEVICIGTELLLGKVVNTNSNSIANGLAKIGINLLYVTTVGDNIDRLKEVFNTALKRSDIVITTGGLGPTKDDISKEIICDIIGLPLIKDQKSYKVLISRLRQAYTSNQEKQVMFPLGSTIFSNDLGTAPGFAIKNGKNTIIMLPGPPRELNPILNNQVLPYLSDDNKMVIESFNIHVFGKGESAVANEIDDLLDNINPTVAPYAKDKEMYVRVTAKANSKKEAEEMAKPIIDEIIDRVGNFVYGIDVISLENKLVNDLIAKDKTISVVEINTGGLLSKRLTDIDDSDTIFDEAIILNNDLSVINKFSIDNTLVNDYGLVSIQGINAISKKAKDILISDLTLVVIGNLEEKYKSNNAELGTIYVAIAYKEDIYIKEFKAKWGVSNRDSNKVFATSYALDYTRRFLANL